jgi:hypothetical protein
MRLYELLEPTQITDGLPLHDAERPHEPLRFVLQLQVQLGLPGPGPVQGHLAAPATVVVANRGRNGFARRCRKASDLSVRHGQVSPLVATMVG